MAGTDAKEKAPATKVDIADVPSAEWGWSGESPKAAKAAAIFVIIALLALLIGNHQGKVEDLFCIGFAVLIAIILIRDAVRSRLTR